MSARPDNDDDVEPQSYAPSKSQIDPTIAEVAAQNEAVRTSLIGFNTLGHFPSTGVNAFAKMEGRILHAIANASREDVIIQIAPPVNDIANTNKVLLRRGNYNSLEVYAVVSENINLVRAFKEQVLPAVAESFPGVTHISITGYNTGAFNFLAKHLAADVDSVPAADGLIRSFGIPVPGAQPLAPKPQAKGIEAPALTGAK
ncbi:MAG: hypothetical protein SFW65_08295 [Alphaproteobacteria bacterium]|nr:hypothetical protein [Alphaproteobacteria bacterium]